MDEENKRKNILDLQFQKYLIYASTAIIIAFTYVIGLVIAFLSKQIRLEGFSSIMVVFFISFGVLGACSIIFLKSRFHLKRIPIVLKGL